MDGLGLVSWKSGRSVARDVDQVKCWFVSGDVEHVPGWALVVAAVRTLV